MAKLWRKLKWLVFFWDTVYSCKTDAVLVKCTISEWAEKDAWSWRAVSLW